MQMKKTARLAIFVLVCGVGTHMAGAVIYNESVSGDLSNSGLTPTVMTVASGSNQVLGTTGTGVTGVDRDYFTFNVPAGLQLASITLLPGTSIGGAFSFIGMEAGNQVTLATNVAVANGLLGWDHYSAAEINTNILATMAVPANGSSGFTSPLGAGSYAFWVQDFNTGPLAYGFDFNVTAAAAVPEPGTGWIFLVGFTFVGVVMGRKLRQSVP
jgi:PEP-CTERM motif